MKVLMVEDKTDIFAVALNPNVQELPFASSPESNRRPIFGTAGI